MKLLMTIIITLMVPLDAYALGIYERIYEGQFYYSEEMQSQYWLEGVSEYDLVYGPRSYQNIPNPEFLTANRAYDSYLLSWQGDLELGPRQSTREVDIYNEQFDGRIVAVIYESDQLWASDMVFGGNSPDCEETLDPQHCVEYRGLEYWYSDIFKISESTLDFNFFSHSNYYDQVRVLTVPVSEPSTSLLMLIGFGVFLESLRRRVLPKKCKHSINPILAS